MVLADVEGEGHIGTVQYPFIGKPNREDQKYCTVSWSSCTRLGEMSSRLVISANDDLKYLLGFDFEVEAFLDLHCEIVNG